MFTHLIRLRACPTPAEIEDEPSCSYTLKNTLRTWLQRDPVDALRDAELLVAALRHHLDQVLPGAVPHVCPHQGVCVPQVCPRDPETCGAQ